MSDLNFIEDADLRELYEGVLSDPWETIELGERLLPTARDRLAVLEAMRESVVAILDDFAEHGDENREMYGDHDQAHFQRLQADLDRRIGEARRAGAKSTVFESWRKTYEASLDNAVGEFMDDMDRDDMAARSLLDPLVEVGSDAAEFVIELRKIERLVLMDPDIANAVAGITSNVLIDCAKGGRIEDAATILRAYLDASPRIGQVSTNQEELAGNALTIAQWSRDGELQERVLSRLIPSKITDDRLAFNLACLLALRHEKKKMLDAVRLALSLGRPPSDFAREADFEQYRGDADFKSLLG